jgi:hypothetical protein
MTKDELLERKVELVERRDIVLAEIKEVQAQLNDIEAQEDAQRLVSSTNPATLDHIARIIQPSGVESANLTGSAEVR